MIELNKKAGIYAEENVINILKEVIAKVYADGYRDGYKECKENTEIDLRSDRTEYIDLGLPSGTLWANKFEYRDGELLYLDHSKASSYSIPTLEQWQELLDNCRWEGISSSSGLTFYGFSCIGPNGNIIKFSSSGFIKTENVINIPSYGGGKVLFWLVDEEKGNEKNAIIVSTVKKSIPIDGVSKCFSGYKLPIRLVRNK